MPCLHTRFPSSAVQKRQETFVSINRMYSFNMRKSFAGNTVAESRHSKLAVGFFVLLFLVFSVFGYHVYDHLVENERQRTRSTLNEIADIQTAAVSGWVRGALGDAMVFSSGRFLGETIATWLARGASADDLQFQIREQLNAIKVTYHYLEVSVLDENGNIRVSTEENPPPLDAVAMETFNRAVATNSLQVSPIRSIAASQYNEPTRRVVDIVAPLLGAQSRLLNTSSVLLLRADTIEQLGPFVQSPPILSASTEVLLTEIREEKVVISASDTQSSRFNFADVLPIAPAEMIAAAQAPKNDFLVKDSQGGALVAVVRKVVGVPWFIVTMIDQSAIRANVQRLAWMVIGAGAGVLSLIGILVLLWWKEKESEFRFHSLQAETEKQLLQQRYDSLSRYANDMIILADEDCRIIDVNDKTLHALGHQRAELIGQPVEMLFSVPCRSFLNQSLTKLLREGVAMFEVFQQHADGAVLPVEVSARATELEGKKFIQLICRDITERKESEAALRESQNRLNSILDSILDVVWSVSADFARLNYVNRSVEHIYGYPVSAFEKNPRLWLEAIHPEDRPNIDHALEAVNPEHRSCEAEFRIVRQDGEIRWLHCKGHLVLDANGHPLRIDGIGTDITRRKAAEQQVQALAYYDNVTMLPNRTLLHDRLAQATHMAIRSQKKVALLFMDLDNFKNVNDSLGHHIGDMLLRAIADRLTQCVREEDTVARIGGDEFLVVLPDIDKGEQAAAVADKILANTAQPFMLQGQQIYSTISVGISIFPDDGKEPLELIQHADSALYQAKGHGRNCYQFFTKELNYQITRSSNIERQLRRAIDKGELSLWYQPQIDTKEGRLIGAEALLRWRHDEHNHLSPVEFVPVAEERGLIGKMGEWAIREACAQCRSWQSQGLHPIRVAVNVSPIQFQQKGFANLVTDILRESGLDPIYLELEITESAIMRRASLVAELAMHLRDAGVRISIDDFGTGYSSLSYLKQIPIDKIKIDRSFISEMLTDVDDEAITHAIINLAHSLNLRVIAEGVESKAQLERLRSFGCNEVQGYYYSSAVSAQVFQEFLEKEDMFAEVS